MGRMEEMEGILGSTGIQEERDTAGCAGCHGQGRNCLEVV